MVDVIALKANTTRFKSWVPLNFITELCRAVLGIGFLVEFLETYSKYSTFIKCGIEQWPARKAHNLEVGGSNPSSATMK